MKIIIVIVITCCIIHGHSFAQTSDDAFRKPLKEVIAEIEKRFDVKIRYPKAW